MGQLKIAPLIAAPQVAQPRYQLLVANFSKPHTPEVGTTGSNPIRTRSGFQWQNTSFLSFGNSAAVNTVVGTGTGSVLTGPPWTNQTGSIAVENNNFATGQAFIYVDKYVLEAGDDFAIGANSAATATNLSGALSNLGFAVTPVAGTAATGSIQDVAKANHVNGEQLVLNDGENPPITFYYDVTGAYVPPGGYDATNVQIDISLDTTAQEVAVRAAGVINAQGALDFTAGVPVAGLFTVTADNAGGQANNNITDTVADLGYIVTGMSGGVSPVISVVGPLGSQRFVWRTQSLGSFGNFSVTPDTGFLTPGAPQRGGNVILPV